MRIILLISLQFLFCWAVLCQAQADFSCEASYFVDSNSVISIDQLDDLPQKPFAENESVNIGYNTNSAVWCTFNFSNETDEVQTFLLCFSNIRIDSLELFINDSKEILGDRTANNSPYLMMYAFEIELQPKSKLKAVVRVKKIISFLDFRYSLRQVEELEKETRLAFFWLSFFIGLIFLLLIFNVILFSITKKLLYFHYIIYSLITTVYVLIATGFAKFVIFPNFLYFSEGLIYTGSIWFIYLSIFISNFLSLKKNQPVKYKIIMIMCVLNALIIISTLICLQLNTYTYLKLFSSLGYINFLLIILMLLVSSIQHLKFNKVYAWYALISFLPHFLWAISIILQAFEISNFGLHANWLVIIAFFDVIFFGTILTKEYLDTYRKNSDLKQRIINNQEINLQSITDAQIRERKQLANIIHDQFGSKLTHVLHLLELQKHTLVEQNVRELTKQMRDISHQIMPKALEEGAFASALENQIEQLNEGLSETIIEFSSFNFPQTIEPQLANILFLISLEVLSNALKHGDSKTISVEIYGYTDSLILQFSDDGVGFDQEKMKKGFGLSTIENRVVGMKGVFDISSNLKDGTVVQISIPMI